MNLKQLQEAAKKNKVKNWWKMKKDDLRLSVVETMGIGHMEERFWDFLIQGGSIEECKPQPNPRIPPPTPKSAHKVKPRKGRVKRKKKVEPKTRKLRERRNTDNITLSQLCDELGVPGRIARRRLREGCDKPGPQWEWPKDFKDISIVKGIITGEVK